MKEVVVDDVSLLKNGSLVIGTVSHIEHSLNAAFIDYGADRHGFLPLHSETIQEIPDLKKGQQLVVRIVNLPEGQNGAALSIVDGLLETERVYKLNTKQQKSKSSIKWLALLVILISLFGLYFFIKS